MNLSGRGTHQVVHVALHCTQNYSNETSSTRFFTKVCTLSGHILY